MFAKVLPWKILLQRTARSYGFVDPIKWLARMRRFSQPSEIDEPIELLRAGFMFHARGLLNTRAIQTNLDWVWPFWVERQFNARDPSFIPRAFSFSHVNLTHRNWTAVGQPDIPVYPIVDPGGLVTPLFDGWSIDGWLVNGKDKLLPSRLKNIRQELQFLPNLAVITFAEWGNFTLQTNTELELDNNNNPFVHIKYFAKAPPSTKLIIAVRPYNPEGIQFIEHASYQKEKNTLIVNRSTAIGFDSSPSTAYFSNYKRGDVLHQLDECSSTETQIDCHVGMVTAAVEFPCTNSTSKENIVSVRIPLADELLLEGGHTPKKPVTWKSFLDPVTQCHLPDEKIEFIFNASIRTLGILSADEIVPGPYTYFRFWFRDACLMINALLSLNLIDRVEKSLPIFLTKQKRSGYFQSQQGEWDSNGQVLWIFNRYECIANKILDNTYLSAIKKAVNWIDKKRVNLRGFPHHRLLPAGFSAEHFGPNDYYYWDDFWAMGGLQAAADIFARHGDKSWENRCCNLLEELSAALNTSIKSIPESRSLGCIPASPYRRMVSGAVGSLVADYPLQLFPASHDLTENTANWLLRNCFIDGCFFQDMVHSGKNIYLTLAVAQTLLRNRDPRYIDLIEAVAEIASDTGQWPEAVHPLTDGGCMGDGQHGWASAEWIMIITHLFVREERDTLIIGSGLFDRWLSHRSVIEFGPVATIWGLIFVEICNIPDAVTITIDVSWHNNPVPLIVSLPGYRSFEYQPGAGTVELQRNCNGATIENRDSNT